MNVNFAIRNMQKKINARNVKNGTQNRQKIVKATYKHKNSSTNDTGAPETIDVLMKNGKTVRYKATNIMK